jgi:hypothetical protein
MPITVTCTCGKQLRVKDEAAGKKGRCPTCKAVFTVPEAAPAPRRSAGKPARKPSIAVGAFTCEGCGAPMASGTILCVRCGFDTRSGKAHKTAVGTSARTAKTRTPLPKRSSGDDDEDAGERPYRDWQWLVYTICIVFAVGAVIGGAMAGIITIHKRWPETAGAQSWELMKSAGVLFGGAIVGALLGQQVMRVLPK